MKNINKYINERLHVTTKSHLYSCQPKTKDELQKIIAERMEKVGVDCNLNDIDVSKIEDMSNLFNGYPGFNGPGTRHSYNPILSNFKGDVSQWDVSNVKNMSYMFNLCENFNCDLSDWDVSNVKYMGFMFKNCKEFDCKLSTWNVSNVKDIENMFEGCENFIQNLNDWDVSKVEHMKETFKNCPTKPIWWRKIK